MNDPIMYGTFIPAAAAIVVAIVTTEATGMEEKMPLPNSNKEKMLAAR